MSTSGDSGLRRAPLQVTVMETTEPETCTYDVDAADRIVAVDARWSQFAIANDAPELAAPSGHLGLSVLDCIADSTTAMLYERLFRRVRETRSAVAFPFRCDSPTRRRFLNMNIERRFDGGLRLETTVTSIEVRPPMALLGRRRDSNGVPLRVCGWCSFVDVAGRWCEVEDAVRILRLFDHDLLPPVTHVMCPPCHERLMRRFGLA